MARRPDPTSLAAAALPLLVLAPVRGQDLPTTLPDRGQPGQPADAPQNSPAAPPAEPTPSAEPDQDADPGRRVMLDASRAVRDLNSLSYRAHFYGTGPIEQIAPRGEGLIRLLRSPRSERVWLQRATGAGVTKAGDPEMNFDIAWLDSSVEWIDHAQKKVLARPTRQAKGPAYQVAGPARLTELTDVIPLSKELQADGYTLEDTVELDGVPCQVVLITLPGGRTQTRWWIAETDHLPRKMARLFAGPSGSGEIGLELTQVIPNPPLTEDDFHIPVPAGYTRDEAGLTTVTTPARAQPDTPAPANPSSGGQVQPPGRPPAPPFDLPSAAGDKVSLRSLAGNVVVLQFWGTWHLPSRAACADFQRLAQQFDGRPVRLFAVAVRERDDNAPREFIRANNYAFGLLLHGDRTADDYNVARYPTYAVIGPAGELLDTLAGYKKEETYARLSEIVTRALADMTPSQTADSGRE